MDKRLAEIDRRIEESKRRPWERDDESLAQLHADRILLFSIIRQQREALETSREKLEIYYKQTNGEYCGGLEFSAVIKKIDEALSLTAKTPGEEGNNHG